MLLNNDRDASPRVQKTIVWVTAIILSIGLAASAWFSPVVAANKRHLGNVEQEVEARKQRDAELARLAEMEKHAAAQRAAQLAQEAVDRRAVIAERKHELEMLARQQTQMTQNLTRIQAEKRRAVTGLTAPMLVTAQGFEESEPVIPEEELLPLMAEIASNDDDPAVRKAALGQLATAGGEAGAEALTTLYETTEEDIKKFVVRSLARNASRPAVEKLKLIAQKDPNAELRLDAVRYLGALARSPKDHLTFLPMPDVAVRPLPVAPPAPPKPPKPDEN